MSTSVSTLVFISSCSACILLYIAVSFVVIVLFKVSTSLSTLVFNVFTSVVILLFIVDTVSLNSLSLTTSIALSSTELVPSSGLTLSSISLICPVVSLYSNWTSLTILAPCPANVLSTLPSKTCLTLPRDGSASLYLISLASIWTFLFKSACLWFTVSTFLKSSIGITVCSPVAVVP